jgi:transposase InsO family protein
VLKDYGITASMSRRGDCWDNACSETLFGSLKVERLHGQTFATRRQVSVSLQSVIFELSIGKRYLQYATRQIPAGQLRSRTDCLTPAARCAVNNFVIE